MPRRFRQILPLAAALALAACTPSSGSWVKLGVPPEQQEIDVAECETYANAISLAATTSSDSTYTGVAVTTTASGDIVGVTTTDVTSPGMETGQFMDRADVFERCMSGRGYKRQVAAN